MTRLQQTSTWQEIHSQPNIWREWAKEFAVNRIEVQNWLKTQKVDQIVFVGAGTSAYIGSILAAEIGNQFFAEPSTSIVANPARFFAKYPNPLVVQFGRSGNSSESIGVIDLLDAHRPNTPCIHITCNSPSALASRAEGDHRNLIILPHQTHDTGFAMTSSFSTMLLTAAGLFADNNWETSIVSLASQAETILSDHRITHLPRTSRVIFLGTGSLQAAAQEMALKVLELTAGQTMTASESSLGFRHGPKAAINSQTQVFVLKHPDPYTQNYDRDIAKEIRNQFPGISVTTLGPGGDIAFEGVGFAPYDALLHVLISQIIAVTWSAELGLNVDNPFIDQGNLSRVVSGVTLYPYGET